MRAPSWFPLAFWAVLLFVVLSGCQRAPDVTVTEAPRTVPLDDQSGGVAVWVDPDTGCEYLLRYDKAITPRYERTGSGDMIRGCR